MHDNYRLMIAQIQRHEGAKRDKDGFHIQYRCPAGKLTIGYGHNLDANPVLGIGEKITEDQATRLLGADILAVQESLDIHLPWIRSSDWPRYAVLVNMAFNMGVGKLLLFRKTLTLVREQAFGEAAAEMLRSLWAEQVGSRAHELAEQMKTGAWQ